MTRHAMIAMSALLLLGAAPAQAKMDCNKDFTDFWKRINLEGHQKLEGAKLADVQRNALRGKRFGNCPAQAACRSGDQRDPLLRFVRHFPLRMCA